MFSKLRLYIDDENVNKGRQIELDIAKGFAIIFMVWVHCMEMMMEDYSTSLPMIVEDFLGGPFAAPVFMFCMGIGMNYTRKSTPEEMMKRGLNLELVGLLLNLFRFTIPGILGTALIGDSEFLSWALLSLIGVDILQFAGLAFLMMGLFKKLNFSDEIMVLISVLMSLAGTFLRNKSFGNDFLDTIAGYLWGTGADTYFPLLNWMIIPVAGYVFGKALIRCKNKKDFYLMLSPVSFVLGIGYLILAHIFKFGMFGENGYYYYMSTLDVPFVLLLVIGIIGIDYFIATVLKKFSFSFFKRISKNINTVYFIHWILVAYGSVAIMLFLDSNISFWMVTVFAVCVLILSDFLAVLVLRLKQVFLIKKSEKADTTGFRIN